MPRIVAELAVTRPVDLAIIDGVESIAGGEGPWIRGIRWVQPGVLIAGTNAVNTDTVATAVMGYDPRYAEVRSRSRCATILCCWPRSWAPAVPN